MKTSIRASRPLLVGMAILLPLALIVSNRRESQAAEKPAAISFDRDIRPILAEHCFACHGPDEAKRKAKFRLDTKVGAFAALRDGGHALVPGKPGESRLIEKITAADPSKRMPPANFGKPLKPEQIAKLKQWVDEGAKWSEHWSFRPIVRPPIPNVSEPAWVRTPIDAFILARIDAERLKHSPEAAKTALIRRVTLDLTGLPPTLKEIDEFLADQSLEAYEHVVDRLLKSPRYGEHMARYWLDAARYGDTHGLHLDNYREIWPYREWVIKAFNDNKPYDRFVVEQLAGDLLPNPTQDQIIATGYNRCHVSTSEGGSIEEEVYVRNVDDQVDTNGTVFMGLSVGCCRCHDHKFDPLTMKDYYSMFAFFNSIDGPALDGNSATYPPFIKVSTPELKAKLEQVQKKADAIQKQIAAKVAKFRDDKAIDAKDEAPVRRADFVWIDDALPAGVKTQVDGGINLAWNFVSKPAPVWHGDKSLKLAATGLKQTVIEQAATPLVVGQSDKLFAYVWLDPKNPPKEIMVQWHTDIWRSRAYWGENKIDWGRDKSPERFHVGPLPKAGEWVRLEVDAAKVGIKPGQKITGWAFTQFDGVAYWDHAGLNTQTPQGPQRFFTLAAWEKAQKATGGAGLPKPVQDILKLPAEKRTAEQKRQLRDHFVEFAYENATPALAPLRQKLSEIEKEREAIDKQMPTTLVFKERAQPRPAYILNRGEYDQHRQQVDRASPAFLPAMPKDAPRNRLGFADWLVAPNHPLTARVAVNRFWQQVFGTGIVRTSEDFGTQGEPPSHPELLDWLAAEFRDSGWNVKRLMKMMVMSSTYRQSSRLTPEAIARDSSNRLLARGPRYRMDAEMLRDQALFISGLLVERLGGPSVKPPQPAGLWEAVGYTGSNTANFKADTELQKVHRRSMYTFWKRTAAPPQMTTEDAPSREFCTMRRERTNTPLQALLMMNEKQYVECARGFGERAMKQPNRSPEGRIAWMFRVATGRLPEPDEAHELMSAYRDVAARFAGDDAAAKKLISIGATKADPALPPTELAAWTMTANIILNLDEVMNKN